jgi:hypothetical protein
VHEVEGARGKARVPGVAGQHLDVGEPEVRGVLPGGRHVGGVGIQPDDSSARRYRVGKRAEHSGRPAAEVDGGLAGPQPDPAKQREGFGPQFR